jgi:RNA polymerase sigma-70 factor, ECF subfamily
MRFHAGLARLFGRRTARSVRYGFINGLPGFVTVEYDGVQTTALEIADGKIACVYVMRNPDKLGHLGGEAVHRPSAPLSRQLLGRPGMSTPNA